MKATTTITNKLGLHARASAKLTKLTGSYACEVWLAKGERRINAKSIMGVMMLAAEEGSTIRVRASGTDEREAVVALRDLVDGKFGGEP